MSKQPFEEFLARLFCQFITTTNSIDTKYHFISSNPDQSIQLYNGFKKINFKSITIGDSELEYIEADNGKKIIVMLHHLGQQDSHSNHEDYIASIRDAINEIDNAILFVIHNSSLETITSTCTDVSAKGSVYTPLYVNKALKKLGLGLKDELIFNYLISSNEINIREQNLSIFGYESLYKSIQNKTIDLKEHGLFHEPRLFDIDNEKELKKELDKNSNLSKKIAARVHDFGDDPTELQRQLEDIGLSERFIKDQFIGKNKNEYKNKTFAEIENEIELNKDRKLDLVNIELNGEKLEQWKRLSETGAARKSISLVGEVTPGTIELKIRMTRGEPLLKLDQITSHGDLKANQIIMSTSNHDLHSTLNVKIPFDGKPIFVQLKLKRPSGPECFLFNCCFVEKETFYIGNYFEKLEVEIKRNKGKIILENIQGKIALDPEKSDSHVVTNTCTKIHCEAIGAIDFSELDEEDILGDFELISNGSSLPITITGTKLLESIKLPSLFDLHRNMDVFEIERSSKYKPSNSRIIINGREKELSVKAKELCIDEYKFISEGVVYFDDISSNTIYLDDLKNQFPEVSKAYKDLYAWLTEQETLLSITNWPPKLLELLESVLSSIKTELEAIPQQALSQHHRNLLQVGMIKKNSQEFFTPFHPVCLAYALEFAKLRIEDKSNSFTQIPPTTVEKFHAGGLLPVLFDEEENYVTTQPISHNRLWLEVVPQKESGSSFIPTLVHEKIQDFLSCFDMLFQQSADAPLIINSINNQNNTHIFKGILNYYKKSKNKVKKIQVNVYDEAYHLTVFERFSETRKIDALRELVRLNSSDKEAALDDLIFKIRKNVTFHKVREFNEYDYAHLSFFKNDEEVTLRTTNVGSAKSGIICQGILSGEASYLENGSFYTGFGQKNIEFDNHIVSIASLYNQLLLAYRDKSARYNKDLVPVLAVKDTFRDKLSKSYESSLWTCIIDPKVTLEFFDTKDTILIHYADQYTNSVAYDAITVSSRVGLYKDLLQSQSDELINSFNALNGQWLLSIVKEAGKNKSANTKKQIKEKQGIVAAYKFLSSVLLTSDIIWVPLSVGEMLRVTGNLGLEIKDNDFAARLHNKSKGALSDDILFVGIKGEQLVLLPLEVKTREKGTDFTKAVKQAKALADHMKRLLEPQTFKGKIYRSLFIQQILTQVDKFELYGVFPEHYFSNLRLKADVLLQGDYEICDLSNYPEGIALAVNEGMERSRIESDLDEEEKILKLRLPQGLVKMLHEESIEKLSLKFQDKTAYPEISKLNLLNSELTTFINQVETTVANNGKNSSIDVDSETTNIADNTPNKKIEEGPITLFDYPEHLKVFVEKLLGFYQRDISIVDILSLTESDFNSSEHFEASDVISFYCLKDALTTDKPDVSIEQPSTNDNSAKLDTINVTSEYRALVNTLLKEFGEDITVNQVMEIGVPSLENINGFGKTKVNRFFEFTNHLGQGSFSINHQENSHQQIENFDLPLDELEEHLVNDLQNYFLQDETRENDILSRRLGVNCDSETLEEIGQSYDVSRERIRQIESTAKKNFIAKLSISPKVVWAITKSNLSELRIPLFPSLRKHFNTDNNFYSFLEVCCGLKENEIKKVTSPTLNKAIFEEFWVWNKSPANIEDLSWYLHENMNVELAVAENQIAIWIEEGVLERIEEEVKPLLLSKVPGITNALLDFPNGDVWKIIQNHANAKNIITGQFYSDRPENSLGYAADKEYVYQSGRGTYRHITYLNISEDEKKRILDLVLSKLNEYKHAGRESVNLSVDIYQQLGLSDDYFIVRHIVRAFGEPVGIYFNGRSGADTVSLVSDFSLASQKTVLIDLFKQSLEPLSKKYIATKIRSQTLGHAAFYLDKLQTEGEIVRIDETHFSHVDNAFLEIDIEEAITLAISFIDNEERIIEGEKIQSYLNRHLDKEFNKYFYISLLKAHASDYGKQYYFIQNLISKYEIEYTGLSDICRESQQVTSNKAEAYAYINDKVCIHEHVLKRCFDQNITTIDITPFAKVETVEIPTVIETQMDNLATSNSPQEKNIESCRILIGQALDNQKPIYWEYGNKDLANRHLIIFGRSGQGKTYCIQGLLMEMAKQQLNSMVVDYTNGFLPEHLEPEFKDKVKPQTDLVAHKPLDLNPFNKQAQTIAGIKLTDKAHDVASRVASVFKSVYPNIGDQQLPTLIDVIEDGIELYGVDFNFERMLKDLMDAGKHGEALANKLSPMVKANIFSCEHLSTGWDGIYKAEQPTTRLIQLATLSRDIWRLATEFILWDLYSYVCAHGSKNNPLPVVLDEVQNLDQKLDSPLGKMLTEGRKYGVSLILATQTLSNLKKDEQDRLFQAAHKLFFAPAETEIDSYAKLLEQAVPNTTKKAWLQELAKLKKGECISVGLHMNTSGFVEQGAKVVKVASLGDRL
ncbi:DNA phosphorothioation-dependent restriction protein DptH [Colwellia sp. TT2012]|uniref:DNA phosphorothioation-dependent restriction protein DptH n=1 Tax=Colwellia sp. TT2012 TaxID=1720342 RepID=UPI000A658519|nr:DNA phosphorothioation-dependent restriction protein DptH [Colwellia sp. TT2012]